MWEQHCKLKQWNTKSVDLEKSFEHLKEDLDKEIQKKRRLEEQMKIYEEKKKHMEKIELLKKKKVLVVNILKMFNV